MDLPDINVPFVLLDNNQQQKDGISYVFHNPRQIIVARTVEEAKKAFIDIDAAVAAGFYVAGWVAYECAAVFEDAIASSIKKLPDEPLVWMMVTQDRIELDKREVGCWLDELIGKDEIGLSFGATDVDENDYIESVAAIKNYIEAGDVYQVNYTYSRTLHHCGSIAALYKRLREQQPVQYGALIHTSEETVLSLSPELFIRRSGDCLTAKPMKGTVARAELEDHVQAQKLSLDEKSRAENLMIVDLIRNDVSRVAKPASVEVQNLFAVETLPSLHQMTSTVTAQCASDLSPTSLFAALFPCGSVTGAPKIRAMEIIAELERTPRGVYCGAIGHFSPASESTDTDWCFNVPIRTMVFKEAGPTAANRCVNDHAAMIGRLGLGSGIVADSNIDSEYEECKLKARFVDRVSDNNPFHLIETMRAENAEVASLKYHIKRMQSSAAVFGFNCDPDYIERTIIDYAKTKCSVSNYSAACDEGVFRLRVTLSPGGTIGIASEVLKQTISDDSLKVCFSDIKISSHDIFRRHKTTLRSIYDSATNWAKQRDYADVIFLNEMGEVAEGAISNVFIETDGTYYTPPIDCGALPGVLRAKLLADSEICLHEKILKPEDLLNADQVYIGNALRGLRAVSVCVQTRYN